MMEKSTYKLLICSNDYYITTDENAEYVQELASDVDDKLKAALKNSNLSMTQAAVFVALEYADMAKKAEASADNLRGQIQGYLADAQQARTDCEVYKREAERLKVSGSDDKPISSLWGN